MFHFISKSNTDIYMKQVAKKNQKNYASVLKQYEIT